MEKLLHLGKMKGQEIAEWMGISYDGTYRKDPSKYIKRLEDYCEYEQVRGGVVIKKIYLYKYIKDLRVEYTKCFKKRKWYYIFNRRYFRLLEQKNKK